MIKKKWAFLLLFTAFIGYSQSLKLEEIMKGNDFIGWQPENPRWSLDGQKVFFEWNPNKEWGASKYY